MNGGKLNPVMDFINTAFSFCMLNLVFMVTCIPVFTIGSALSSLYYVMGKETKGEYGYLVRTYLHEFKRNFKNGTIAFLLLFFMFALLIFNLLFWFLKGTSFSAAAMGILAALSIVWLSIFHYTFPLIGRFVNTPIQYIKNAWGLALRNIKQTLALLSIDIATACFCLFIPLGTVFAVFFFLGFVLIVYFQSFILNKVFRPYEQA